MGIGYELVQKNYVRAGGELDLIMKEGKSMFFVK
jgi:Holliday junction resolvase-like predicted endonuclease